MRRGAVSMNAPVQPPWQPPKLYLGIDVVMHCPYCGAVAKARLRRRAPSDPHGTVRVMVPCRCGAVYHGSVSGEWYAPETQPEHSAESRGA